MNSEQANGHPREKLSGASPFLQPLPPAQRLINRRQIWAANRFWMEMDNLKTRRYGNKGPHHWYKFLLLMKTFRVFLTLTGLFKKGVRNAEDITLREIPLYFRNLPEAFEGFTILHLSDLHLDSMVGLEDRILGLLNDRTVDLCALTGDYRSELHGVHKHITKRMKYLIDRINSRQGFIGVLGNHDSCHMVNSLEYIGIHILINNTCFIHRGEEKIQIIGTDDVHYYYTDQALHALEHADDAFSIIMVHSPELVYMAAQMGVDLYLCGHTHAGQICLPGGAAIIKHVHRGRKYYRGHWQHMGMQGFTSSGLGTSGIPARFNTRGEVLIHHLHRSAEKF